MVQLAATAHDDDAAVGHGRTLVERSAHRAPSEARPSHVVRAEQVGRGGPAGMGGGLKATVQASAWRRARSSCAKINSFLWDPKTPTM